MILFLITPLEFIGNFLAAAGGHNKSFSSKDYLLFAFALTTVITMTIYESSTTEYKAESKLLFLFVICLILTSIIAQLYIQIDTIYICNCFEENGVFLNSLFLIFILTSFLVLVGLFFNRKRFRSP
jgi:Na+/alanine symporter